MSSPTKFVLDESKMPRHWYNIAADLPKPAPPVTPAPNSLWAPTIWRRCSRWR
jgi:tryptophan synthase beta chain